MENESSNDTKEQKNNEKGIMNYDEMPLFLDVNDISKMFRIGRNSAYELFKSAEFPKLMVAGQYRVCKDELRTWLKNNIIKRR
jgi:hypothetical protein